jgi:hypothetical protein
MEKLPAPPNPLQFLIQGLADPDPDARVRAVESITLAVEEGINASTAISGLASLIGDMPVVAESAAKALYACFLKGGDLNTALPNLETALESPLIEVRAISARIVSRYKILRGEEAPLKLHPTFKIPPATRNSSWAVNVSHRRTYATMDNPITGEIPRACGVCNSEKTQCIFVKIGGEEYLPSKDLEYKCSACGKYTMYSQEVW